MRAMASGELETAAGGRVFGRTLATIASGLASLLLHGAVLAAIVYWVEHVPGAVPQPTDAISIELLQTEILETVTTTAALEAAASPESVQSDPGEDTESAAAGQPPPDQLRPTEPEEQVAEKETAIAEVEAVTPQGLDILQGREESEHAAGAEEPSPRPLPQKVVKPPREVKKPVQPLKTAKRKDAADSRKAESTPKTKGGAASRATKGSAGSSGRVSASRGSAINYAAIVRARVAARKPGGAGQRGTLVIAFGVSRSGSMSYARITRSSGNPGLDSRVLAAVRGAGPFPAPPPGANLRFAITFNFR